MNRTGKTLLLAGNSLLFLICTLLVAEGLLRLSLRMDGDPNKLARTKYENLILSRIQRLWTSSNGSDPFFPPFLVYSNKDSTNNERLDLIYRTTRLPSSRQWRSYDFLQNEALLPSTAYSIKSNSLGFRGDERSRKKKKNTRRIIVLGSYQAFGHGVNDDETYPARMEQFLNQTSGGMFNYEVWNGGRHAGTAIVGLARMRREIFDFQPDMFIIDYGHSDGAIRADNFIPISMRVPNRPAYAPLRFLISFVSPILGKSLLWHKFWYYFWPRNEQADSFVHYKAVVKQMLALAAEKHIPVILVKQLSVPEFYASFYTQVTNEHVQFVDVNSVFLRYPPTLIDLQVDRGKTWLGEVPPQLWNQLGAPSRHFPYSSSTRQLSAKGQLILGRELARRALRLLRHSEAIP